MKRRQFLIAAGAATAAAATGAGWWLLPARGPRELPLAQALHGYARSLEGVQPLGHAYLERSEADVSQLTSALVAGLGDDESGFGRADIADMVRKRIVADFLDGELCEVDGWQLALTECRLAALHVRLTGASPPATGVEPGFENAAQEPFIDIVNWGPQETAFGVAFNVQPDGHSGMWFAVDRPPPRSLEVYLDGESLPTTIRDDVITVGIYDQRRDELIQSPGDHEIHVYDKERHVKQKIGELRVGRKPEYATLPDGSRSNVFCPVEGWGPARTEAGEPFNLQPNGSSAFWVRIECAPHDTVMKLNGHELETTVRSGIVTARLEDPALYADSGTRALVLHHSGSGETLPVGEFEIRP